VVDKSQKSRARKKRGPLKRKVRAKRRRRRRTVVADDSSDADDSD